MTSLLRTQCESTGSHHSTHNAGLFKTIDTIRAPLLGGLDHVCRTIISHCDSACVLAFESFATMTKFPTRSSTRKY